MGLHEVALHLLMRFAAGKAIGTGKIAGINDRNAEVGMGAVEGVRQRRFQVHHNPKGREKRQKGGKAEGWKRWSL